MAFDAEKRNKNLVYLMLTRYDDDWEDDFPYDMGIDHDVCQKLYDRYAGEVRKEIDAEEATDEVPSADELIDKGMKKLSKIINNCDDPAKLTTAIDKLSSLRDSNAIKTEKKETIFDKIQKRYEQN